MNSIKVGIIGGAGYTGGEMIRLLIRHPAADIRFIHSRSNAGKPVHSAHEDLVGETELVFDAEWRNDVDVLFLCVGHGEAKKFVEEAGTRLDTLKLIDLSQDFRLNVQPWIYGLPELNRDLIRNAKRIANPGCFATAIQLGLLPLAKAGLLTDVYSTGITGSTGAGQGLSQTSHFSWRSNNIQAYKTLTHQHLAEIGQTLGQLQDKKPYVHFVPWRGDFTRGIFISSQIRCDKSTDEVWSLFEDYYQGHPFTHVSRTPISLKQVVNTNKCLIQLEKVDDELVIHTAIDNLVKGASGQAVQNMNLLFGLEETAGLQLKSIAF